MTLVRHVLFGVAAGSVVVAAARIAGTMGRTRSIVGPVAVLTIVASWALCVWLTPIGPRVWRASALGFLAAGAFLVASLDGARGIFLFRRRSERLSTEVPRGRMRRKAAWLVLLMFAIPLLAHLSALGGAPGDR